MLKLIINCAIQITKLCIGRFTLSKCRLNYFQHQLRNDDCYLIIKDFTHTHRNEKFKIFVSFNLVENK